MANSDRKLPNKTNNIIFLCVRKRLSDPCRRACNMRIGQPIYQDGYIMYNTLNNTQDLSTKTISARTLILRHSSQGLLQCV